LIYSWGQADQTSIDQTLASLALDLARRARHPGRRHDLYIWHQVLRLLYPSYPRQTAELILSRLTDSGGSTFWEDPENDVLALAAAADPAAVMEAIGDAVLDPHRRQMFGVAIFHGMFEPIGVPHVAAWVSRHGREQLRWLARHFRPPYLDEAGRAVVPPLADWLFREHEDDDRAFEWFLMGSDDGGFRSEADVNPARKREEMRPFLMHELRRVREWAEYQIRHEDRFAEWFREMDEEDERR
jgi:hypothetical protein